MQKKEKLFIFGILLAALLLWGAIELLRPRDFGRIRITVDGAEFGVYSLADDQIIPIGDTNICEIRDGSVRMIEASCPDHLCIKQGAISGSGGMIVCLPNKIVIEGVKTGGSGQEDPEVDAVA